MSPQLHNCCCEWEICDPVKERGCGKTFSIFFWMRFSQAHLCHYRFKVISNDIILLRSGNVIEYISFCRFNSINII